MSNHTTLLTGANGLPVVAEYHGSVDEARGSLFHVAADAQYPGRYALVDSFTCPPLRNVRAQSFTVVYAGWQPAAG